jgi:predicted ABC-type transport system involved in lysophospholipase L1 biosynthesis ATPase subunit
VQTAHALHDLLESLAKERGMALVVATHSPSLARRAHRSLVLQDGSLQPLDTVEAWA